MEEIHSDTVLRLTPTGYSNNEISLEWLQHFNEHSAKTSLKGSLFLMAKIPLHKAVYSVLRE